jgi:hypothetical protein
VAHYPIGTAYKVVIRFEPASILNLSNNETKGIIRYKVRMQIAHTVLLLSVIMMLSLAGCAPQPNPNPPLSSYPNSVPTVPPVLDTIKGSLRNQINMLEKDMPRSKSEGYTIPTDKDQADFAKLTSMIIMQDLAHAVDLATRNDYTLNYYVDRGDNYAISYLLREQRPIQKGWGLYAFRLDSTSNIIIEAPHPLYDQRTPSVAMDIYRALDARALLIAGAHRNANGDKSADVAHAPESIFQSIHTALSQKIQTASGDVIILQIHGFHTSKHEGYPQVVFGLGENPLPKEVAIAKNIKDALSHQGISAGVCTGVESELMELCAKTNIQGSVTKAGSFIHIELDEEIRKNDDGFIAALVEVFGNGS